MRKLLALLIVASSIHASSTAAQVAGVRSFGGVCAAGGAVAVSLDVDVEAQAPNGVIIVEQLPAGWTLGASSPPASSFNSITGEVRWVFFGAGVNDADLDVQYTAVVSDPAGAAISGELRYNDPEGMAQAVAIGGASTCDRPRCVGDCDGSGEVTINEILSLISITLGNNPPATCPAADGDANGVVTVDEIVQAVNNALSGCS